MRHETAAAGCTTFSFFLTIVLVFYHAKYHALFAYLVILAPCCPASVNIVFGIVTLVLLNGYFILVAFLIFQL